MSKIYFFDKNEAFKDKIICIDDGGKAFTYQQIWDMGDELTEDIKHRRTVVLQCSNDVESLSSYLALLRKRCPVILIGKQLGDEPAAKMREAYEGTESIHPDLGLLLSTSGSTGAQKLVRLSYDNIQANCDSIVEYLGLTERERPITTLPMEYTYGLSVIQSHIAVGAGIVLTNKTLFEPEFWKMVREFGVTSMAGVPYTYEMMDRLHIEKMDLPELRTLTQAGGHLKAELQKKIAEWADRTGRRFFVMYGQTEATARMSYVPPERCLDKLGSIGIPVPGGRMELEDDGELIYYGKNVSMGYAVCREDLAKGDENCGRLATGDIAYRDEEGYYYISGRKKRFIKLYGKRIGLDHIQDDLQEIFDTPDIVCTGDDDKGIFVWIAGCGIKDIHEQINKIFQDKWGIRESNVTINMIDKIPRNASGKTVYRELK